MDSQAKPVFELIELWKQDIPEFNDLEVGGGILTVRRYLALAMLLPLGLSLLCGRPLLRLEARVADRLHGTRAHLRYLSVGQVEAV